MTTCKFVMVTNVLKEFAASIFRAKLETGTVCCVPLKRWNYLRRKTYMLVTPPQAHKFNSHHRGNFKFHTIVILLDALVSSSVLLPFLFVSCPGRILNTWIIHLPC
jgi:hypothetical protein